MTTELSRPIAVDHIGATGQDVLVEANAAERAALAERLQIPAVHSLTCRFHLEHAHGDVLMAFGHFVAEIEQNCVVSLEDFASAVEERFVLRCVPAGYESDDIDPDAPDEFTYEGGTLDLGEATAQQLALALDPYPRAPDAKLPSVDEAPDEGPFARLSALRRPN